MKSQELYHYGVKGMKWGVRKADYNAMSRDQRKAHKKQFKADVKDYKKNKGMLGDYELDKATGEMRIKQFRNSKGEAVSKEYADAVMAKVRQERGRKVAAGVLAGLGAVTVASVAANARVIANRVLLAGILEAVAATLDEHFPS